MVGNHVPVDPPPYDKKTYIFRRVSAISYLIINLYRKLTPKSRSEDEHPLLKKDFDYIKEKFIKTEIKYYGFLTLVFFPFYKNPKKSILFKYLAKFDQFLFKTKFFRLLAWSVLIIAKKN